MEKASQYSYYLQNMGVFFLVLGIFPFMPDKITDTGFALGILALLYRYIKLKQKPDFWGTLQWRPLIGMLVFIVTLIVVSRFAVNVKVSTHGAYGYFKNMKPALGMLLLMNNSIWFFRAVFYALGVGVTGLALGPNNMIYQYLHRNSRYLYQYNLHRNSLATVYLFFIATSIAYILNYVSSKIERILWGILVMLSVLMIFVSQSRGAFLTFILCVFVGLILYSRKRTSSIYKVLGAFLALGIIVVGGSKIAPKKNHIFDLKKTFNVASSVDSHIDKNRLYLYEGSIAMIKAHPLTGVGIDNFTKEYNSHYKIKKATELNLPHAHNFALAFLTTTGVVGFCAFLFLEWQFVSFFLKYKRLSLAKIGMFIILGLLFKDLVDFSLFVSLLAKMYWIILLLLYCGILMKEKVES